MHQPQLPRPKRTHLRPCSKFFNRVVNHRRKQPPPGPRVVARVLGLFMATRHSLMARDAKPGGRVSRPGRDVHAHEGLSSTQFRIIPVEDGEQCRLHIRIANHGGDHVETLSQGVLVPSLDEVAAARDLSDDVLGWDTATILNDSLDNRVGDKDGGVSSLEQPSFAGLLACGTWVASRLVLRRTSISGAQRNNVDTSSGVWASERHLVEGEDVCVCGCGGS
ncbi:hypothetical protein EDB80DRAFT_721400 [Ilyonectria destructans]|nr:hypothetical protein EDB80DRAFT_721400 [Ilyonectria destructans]